MDYVMRKTVACSLLASLWGSTPALADSTFMIENPPLDFGVIDNNPFDGVGDTGPFPSFDTVGFGTTGEKREIAEFDISGFSVPQGEFISSAIYEVIITSLQVSGFGVPAGDNPDSMAVYGYAGNGADELADFQAGVFLDNEDTSNPFVGQILTFDVTSFVTDLVNANETWVGLAVRGEEFGLMSIAEGNGFPRLIIQTVPAPATLALLALGALGRLRRRPG